VSFACFAGGTEPLPSSSTKAASIVLKDLAGASVQPLASAGRKATVFFFVMHECPVANGYAPEIARITSEYAAKGVRCFVVYVESDLSPEKARVHARDYGYKSGPSSVAGADQRPPQAGAPPPLRRVDALLDPQHQLVKAAGATISPEAAVLSPSGEVLYRGRIDDRVADFGKRRVEPTRRDLRLALDAILEGKPVQARLTKAVGCYIPEDNTPQRK
jgi:hypothetical protein